MRRRSFVVVVVAVCAAPFLALACGGGDGSNANVPPQQQCPGHIGISITACPDASPADGSIGSDARAPHDAAIDAAKDAGYFPPPPAPPACTGTVAVDTTFGTNGFVINTTSGADFAGIGVQPDGKYVVVTTDGPDPSPLARRLVNGSIDTTFGTSGYAPAGQQSPQVIVEPSGRIVTTGTDGTRAALLGFTSAGVLDDTFAVHGVGATTLLAPIGIQAPLSFIAQRPNGKFVGAATVYVRSGHPTPTDIGLVQFDSNGIADTTFGNHGIAFAGYANPAAVTAMLIEPDGKILVGGFELNPIDDAGNGHQDFTIVRFNEDGSLDTTFGSGGKMLVPIGSRFIAFAPVSFGYQSTGNVVVAVGSDLGGVSDAEPFALMRITPTGDVDLTFGAVGFASAIFLGGADNASNVVVYADDSIVAGGSVGTLDDAGFQDTTLGFAKFTANGVLDTTFGTNGTLIVNPPGIREGSGLTSAILQSNGQIFASAIGENEDADESLDDYGVLFRLTCN